MGASTPELFGGSSQSAGEPATPGTYGAPAPGFRLPQATRLGPVLLQVADLERSLAFYMNVLGLRPLHRTDAFASLGPESASQGDERPLVQLRELPGARSAARRGRLGLFHFAILMPDRAALGRLVEHLRRLRVPAGASDHLVSEALYLSDPDGLGIEVYADRPRTMWRRVGRELMMATDPLDLDDLVRAAKGQPFTAMPAGTTMGHVHLHVGDLAESGAFFSDALGFDRVVWRYPGALFLSAGGYHHHLGTNTWAGPGARPAEPGDARLLEWTIQLPDDATLRAAEASLTTAGRGATRDDRGSVLTSDPWGTTIRLTA